MQQLRRHVASPGSGVPLLPERGHRHLRCLGSCDRGGRDGEPSVMGAPLSATIRRRHRGHRRGSAGSPVNQHRRRGSRRTSGWECMCTCASSSTRTSGFPCSSRTRARRRTSAPRNCRPTRRSPGTTGVGFVPCPHARSSRTRWRSPASGCPHIGRRLMLPPLSLTVEAIKEAVSDAGLTLDDIDGLSTYPGGSADGGFGEGGDQRRRGRSRAATDLVQRRRRDLRAGRIGDRGNDRRGRRSGPPRRLLPHRLAGHLRGRSSARRDPDAARTRTGWRPAARPECPGYYGPYGIGSAAINLAMVASNHFKRVRHRPGRRSAGSPSTSGPTPCSTPRPSTGTR